MWLPPGYREPHSSRYWLGYTVFSALLATALVVAGVVYDRTFTIVLAIVAPLQTAAWCLVAKHVHHGPHSAESRTDVGR